MSEVSPTAATHHLKAWPTYFDAVLSGAKPFDVRFNDRNYRTGDRVVLHEWNPGEVAGFGKIGPYYTGRELRGTITYVFTHEDARSLFGRKVVAEDYVVLGLRWDG